jgi:hypothetical protein
MKSVLKIFSTEPAIQDPAATPPDDDHGRRTFARRARTYPKEQCAYCGAKLPEELVSFGYCDSHCKSQWNWEIAQADNHQHEMAAIERKKAGINPAA